MGRSRRKILYLDRVIDTFLTKLDFGLTDFNF